MKRRSLGRLPRRSASPLLLILLQNKVCLAENSVEINCTGFLASISSSETKSNHYRTLRTSDFLLHSRLFSNRLVYHSLASKLHLHCRLCPLGADRRFQEKTHTGILRRSLAPIL